MSDTKTSQSHASTAAQNPSTHLDLKDVLSLQEYLEHRSLPAGGLVFAEGDHGDSLYFIKSGLVEIVKRSTDEHAGTIRLARRGPGEIIGEMAVIEEAPRFATVVCAEPTELAVMSRESFLRLLAAQPTMALRILRVMIDRLKETDLTRLRETEEKNKKLEASAEELHKILVDLQEANQQLSQALQSRQQLLDVSPSPIIVTNVDFEIIYCNPATTPVFEVQTEDCLGRQIGELFGLPNLEYRGKVPEILLAGQEWRGEATVTLAGGRRVYCRVEAVPVPVREGEDRTFLFIFYDETEIRELQRQAAARDRLANKGEMAAEIAHELNNYLAVLSGNVELLPMFLGGDISGRVTKCLNTLETSLTRMQVFTTALLSSRLPQHEKLQQDLNQFIENQITFLKPQKKFKKINIKSELDPNLPDFAFDQNGLQQVLYNLLLNSAEALVDQGNVEPAVGIRTRYDGAGNCATIEIQDNGPGIAAEIRDKLFEQNVTTKPQGHGIGLITVRKIINEHDGSITVADATDGGAVFTLTLPIPQGSEDTTPIENTQ